VGTSLGLFAENKTADFDLFICKDGSSEIPAESRSNYFGVTTLTSQAGNPVTNTSKLGGWFMISGVELGKAASSVTVSASAKATGQLEVYVDDIQKNKLIATIPVSATGANSWKSFSKTLNGIGGQHDIFVKFSTGSAQNIQIKSIKFTNK